MSRLLEEFTAAFQDDTEDQGDRLETYYKNGDAATKKIIDDVLIMLCGYSLPTLCHHL